MKKIILLLLCASLLPIYAAETPKKEPPKEELPYKNLSVFMESLMLLREKYVDTGKISYENLLRAAMRGMMHELDPFSSYEEPDQFKNTVEDTMGRFPGVGIVVTGKNNSLEIVTVMEDAPAAKAGLQSGDVIMEIDGKSIRMTPLSDCIKMLKGPPGTKVKVKFYRKNGDLTKETEIERAVITVSSVKGTGTVADKIGYLRITQFTASTAGDLDKALTNLRKTKPQGLIIDLRNNPGGLLNAAVDTISRFIEKDKPVVSIEGRAEKTIKHNAIACEKDLNTPIVVLLNENSASASEIFAACMQDSKRAILVGARSFGKGSVQAIVPLSDGGALRITTAKYYTPGRKEIHGKGVNPDIAVNTSPLASIAVARYLSMQGNKAPAIRDGKYYDAQLERAVEILKGVNIFRQAEK